MPKIHISIPMSNPCPYGVPFFRLKPLVNPVPCPHCSPERLRHPLRATWLVYGRGGVEQRTQPNGGSPNHGGSRLETAPTLSSQAIVVTSNAFCEGPAYDC